MRNVCNVGLPQAIGDVISSIGISTAAADSIGRQHGIGLTLINMDLCGGQSDDRVSE